VVHARTADGVAHLGLRPGGGISGLQVVDQTGRSQQIECVTSGGAGELRLESSEPWSIIDGVGPRSGPFRVETSGEVVVDDRGAAVSFTGGSGELIVRCS